MPTEELNLALMIEEFCQSPNFTSLALSTQEFYQSALGTMLNAYAECKPVPQTPTEFLKQASAALSNRDISGVSIQQYVTVAKIMFRWAGRPVEFTHRIPSEERKAGKLKKINRWFSQAEIDACLQYRFSCNHERNHLIIQLLIETGARVRELANVSVADVRLAERTIFLSDSKTQPRPVFFSEETGMLLGLYIERLAPSRRIQLRLDILDNEKTRRRLFVSVQQIQKIVNDMLIDLKLKTGKDGRGPHTFRHWCATHLHYAGGMSLADIGFLLGDKPDMIRDKYLHPTAEMLQGRMNQAMGW